MAIKGVLAYLIAIWVAFVIWVVRDITNRSSNILVQTFSILLIVAFTPIFGLPLYLLVRPRSTLFEKYYEEVGLAESESFEGRFCEECEEPVSPEYRYCPHCRHELLVPCRHCGELASKDWDCCAYCGTPSPAKPKTEELRPKKKSHSKKADYPEIVSLNEESEPESEAAEKKAADASEPPSVPEKPETPAEEAPATETPAEKPPVTAKVYRLEEIPEAGK